MMKERIEKLNPENFISNLLKHSFKEVKQHASELSVEHIIYNPSVNKEYQYKVIEHSKHDGTVLFTLENIDSCLMRLINKQTYFSPLLNGKNIDEVKDIVYEIGDIEVKSLYGVKVKHFIGVDETISIPVKCNLIFK